MQIVSIGNYLHELQNPDCWEKLEKYFSVSFAKIFSQSAKWKKKKKKKKKIVLQICLNTTYMYTTYVRFCINWH